MTQDIPTAVASYVWSSLLLLIIPIGLLVIIFAATTGSPAGGPAKPIALIVYGLVAALGIALTASIKRSDVRLNDGELTLRGSLYKRSIKLSDIDSKTVAVHDDRSKPALGIRTNGIGLPGYSAGWFRGRSGERMFVVYGGGPHLSFKTRDGVLHVVGTEDAGRLKTELVSA